MADTQFTPPPLSSWEGPADQPTPTPTSAPDKPQGNWFAQNAPKPAQQSKPRIGGDVKKTQSSTPAKPKQSYKIPPGTPIQGSPILPVGGILFSAAAEGLDKLDKALGITDQIDPKSKYFKGAKPGTQILGGPVTPKPGEAPRVKTRTAPPPVPPPSGPPAETPGPLHTGTATPPLWDRTKAAGRWQPAAPNQWEPYQPVKAVEKPVAIHRWEPGEVHPEPTKPPTWAPYQPKESAAPAAMPTPEPPAAPQAAPEPVAPTPEATPEAQSTPEPPKPEPTKIWQKGDPIPPYEQVVNINPHDLVPKPAVFQYKHEAVGKGGTTDEFRDVKQWDAGLGGAMAVWQDPVSGDVSPVNGHHRTEMAQRLNPPSVNVRFIPAKTAEEARTFGAMLNRGEGKGTSIDAAKLFRDAKITPEDLQKYGIAPTSRVALQGMGLSKLEPSIYRQVAEGKITPTRGALIGSLLADDHAAQKAAVEFFKASDKAGKRYDNAEAADIIRGITEVPDTVERKEDLFGVDEVRRKLLGERAEVSAAIGKRLGKEKDLFKLVSKQGNADRLGSAGNILNSEENAKISQEAAQVQAVYDKLKFSAGPVADALNQAAKEVAEGVDVDVATERAYAKIKDGVAGILSGKPASVTEPSGGSGQRPSAPELPKVGGDRTSAGVGDSRSSNAGKLIKVTSTPSQHSFVLKDDNGKTLVKIEIEPAEGSGSKTVDDANTLDITVIPDENAQPERLTGKQTSMGPQVTVGVSTIKDSLAQIANLYPNAEKIKAPKVTGSHYNEEVLGFVTYDLNKFRLRPRTK